LRPQKFVLEHFNGQLYLIPIIKNNKTITYDGHIYLNELYFNNFCSIWEGIRTRTNNPNNKYFNHYGGRNISSDAYEHFIDFYKELYDNYIETVKKYPNEKITIDRIDVNEDYCKDNCRWIPLKWQNGNQTRNKWILATNGNHKYITKNIKKFSDVFQINYSSIRANLAGKTNYVYDIWKFEYIDIQDYESLPIDKINVIIDIFNYPNYEIVYEDIL
jgi:hypothetical protein